jgi:hypothetical protein
MVRERKKEWRGWRSPSASASADIPEDFDPSDTSRWSLFAEFGSGGDLSSVLSGRSPGFYNGHGVSIKTYG